MRTYRIAVIPGDGIGREVVPEGVRVLQAAARRFGFSVDTVEFPWGCGYYLQHGAMMPSDGLEQLRAFDAILLGAVGDPRVPDHVSLWGLLLRIRKGFDLYVNLRPVRLLEGVPGPLAGRGPADVDMVFVRENTEGEYAGVGGR
ncbi:MAG: isocitrate/isopropylmalate family dehydrogenase, partial [Armatimonadota bacterium]|nr:isocitrate/isopropylmalate family dehydrogenase [Armatimonadota bacterium]